VTEYRLFFANGKSRVVPTEQARDRMVGKAAPRVIHVEVALVHRCQTCGTEGAWRTGWIAYPADLRTSRDRDMIFCSRTCWAERTGGPDLPRWYRFDEEPRPREYTIALYEALRQERERKSEMAARRKVPMPEWKGRGFCKWCNGQITKADGRALYWHPGCIQQYLLHSRAEDQFRFLRRRDGQTCAAPDCESPGFEVDHRTPLWSVWDLPPDERRRFYGPDNLQLLCGPCHKAKSAREARERADRRRDAHEG